MVQSRTAIAIAGYNRPQYFQPALRSILANDRLAECDLWLFLDGGRESALHDYRRIVHDETTKSAHTPLNLYFIERPTNVGCGVNLIDARGRLFDHAGYERALIFEDDMVVSPHYLALADAMLDWSESQFTDVGVVQPYCACRMPFDEKVCRLDEVDVGNPHWWGYLMPRSTWLAIRDTLYDYEQQFLTAKNYQSRRHRLIQQWAVSLLNQKLETVRTPADLFHGSARFPRQWNYLRYFGNGFATGQDSMTVLAMTLAGRQKLITPVNRGLPIGVEGLHSTEAQFQKSRLHEIKLENFASDALRCEFRIPEQPDSLLKPWMRPDETDAIRLLLQERRPQRVLEFGAGGSTVTFSREPAIGEWWSVEQSEVWVRRVLAAQTPADAAKITILVRPEKSVVSTLEQLLALDFDMFFVDGFDRCAILRCLRKHLEHHPGFVVLHDASRPCYESAITLFPKRRHLSTGNGKHQGLMLLEV